MDTIDKILLWFSLISLALVILLSVAWIRAEIRRRRWIGTSLRPYKRKLEGVVLSDKLLPWPVACPFCGYRVEDIFVESRARRIEGRIAWLSGSSEDSYTDSKLEQLTEELEELVIKQAILICPACLEDLYVYDEEGRRLMMRVPIWEAERCAFRFPSGKRCPHFVNKSKYCRIHQKQG